jgi:RNA polymerase sigma factor FliA
MDGDDHIVGHVGAAWRIAVQYSIAYQFPLDDLISAASEGLVRAARAFDPARDRKFWGYAKHRVRGMVMDLIRTRARQRVPTVDLDTVRLTAETHLSDPFLLRNIWRVLDLMDTERRTLTHEKYAHRNSPSRRAVIEMFYFDDMSMEEIGERLGCHESRVCQIHRDALAGLRRALAPLCAIPGHPRSTRAVRIARR